MNELKRTALIMAGGRGTRFWPKSRKSLPKQFLSLTGDGKTMLQLTVERILPIVDMEDIFISTNYDYKDIVIEQLPDLPKKNILCEPVGRNTAPCIGLGAIHIQKKYDDAIIFVISSDHQIKIPELYRDTLLQGSLIASENNNIVQIGITPNYPETGYGYIKFDPEQRKISAYKVDKFVEKPNLEKAKEYLKTNQYLWNAGLFIWKASTVLSCMKEFMKDTYDKLMVIQDSIGQEDYEEILEKEFSSMESISIDYGIMEKAEDIYVIPGNFGWDDVGSWLAVGRLQNKNEDGNVINGDVITLKTEDSIIQGNNKLIAIIGVENIIVVDSDDALLIADADHAGDIKEVMEILEKEGREELL